MKNKNGFSLVELLAVIVVLAALLIIAIPSVLNVLKDSSEKIDEFNQKSLLDAASLYLQDIEEKIYTYTNDTGSTITIAATGRSYANGEALLPYDFKSYVIEQHGIDIKITDLISKGYFDPNCDYSINPKSCKIKNTCVITGKIKYETANGYYITTGYDAVIKSGCEKTGK